MEHDHILSSRRIEAFSDAVFAIIVTLLVLDLHLPELVKNIGNEEALKILLDLAPQFIAFLFSFLIVCIFWVNHHQFFMTVKKADRKFLWLNNILLFWLCFTPFPTAFLGRAPTNMVAVMLFGFVLFCAASTFSLLIHHALFKGDLVDTHIEVKERKAIQNRTYFGVVLYGLSVLLAPISVYISLAIFVFVPVFYFVPQKLKFS